MRPQLDYCAEQYGIRIIINIIEKVRVKFLKYLYINEFLRLIKIFIIAMFYVQLRISNAYQCTTGKPKWLRDLCNGKIKDEYIISEIQYPVRPHNNSWNRSGFFSFFGGSIGRTELAFNLAFSFFCSNV